MKAQTWHKVLFVYIFAFLVFTLHAYAANDTTEKGGDEEAKKPMGAIKMGPEHEVTPEGKLVPKDKAEETPKKDAKSKESKESKDSKPAVHPVKKGGKLFAIMETNKGKMKIHFFNIQAPKTVENFVGLATGTKEWVDPKTDQKVKKPYYDGLIFHRVIAGFMIQGGDPLGNGTGGPGFTIDDEPGALALEHNKMGILSMAKTAAPNSGGSQFFITLGPTPHLNKVHAVFGEVVEGLDVLKAIGSVKTDPRDKPLQDVVIKSITITDK